MPIGRLRIEVVMARIVSVQDKFLDCVRLGIKEDILQKKRCKQTRMKVSLASYFFSSPYKSQREVVVEVVRLLSGRLPPCAGRVDLHLVLRLEEDPRRRADG